MRGVFVLLLMVAMMEAQGKTREIATFGMGCFWCSEAVFSRLAGVDSVRCGYSGGHVPNPTYQQVCTGATGHAEVLQVVFDPSKITYEELLAVFFKMHDPTTLNQQGADVGTQYRSVIFTHSARQRQLATEVIAHLTAEKVFSSAIVTEVRDAVEFYPAEEYHVDYYARNPREGYCRMVIGPKVKKLEEFFARQLKEREGHAD